MNVSLTPELEQFARGLVAEGDYGSASEVMREALRLLKQKREHDQKLMELRGLIEEGLQGPVVRMTREDIRAMVGQRMSQLQAEVERGDRPALRGSRRDPGLG